MIAYLQTLGGTPTVTLQTKHHYNSGAAAAPAAAPSPGGSRVAAEGPVAMKIPILARRARRVRRCFASGGPTC